MRLLVNIVILIQRRSLMFDPDGYYIINGVFDRGRDNEVIHQSANRVSIKKLSLSVQL